MSKILKISIVAALSGFLFGFDTIVISGADKQLQDLWNTSDLFHGTFIMSMALWGTVLGSVFASYPTDFYGRKNTLIIVGFLYFLSAIGSAFAFDPYLFSFFRFIGGIGVGISTIAAPTYISEISPENRRGQLVILFQFNIVFGILIAFFSNYLLRDFGYEPWRWMIGMEIIPAIIFLISIFWVPKSPRWLIFAKNEIEKARKIHFEISNNKLTENEILILLKNNSESKVLFKKKYSNLILLAFLIAFFNQLSGINAFLYYAPRIFEAGGLEKSSALLGSFGVGIINLIFTGLGLYLIDRVGRKPLMYICSFGYIISLSLVSISFLNSWSGFSIPFFFFLFIASHAIGQGAVIWVFISEIFPNKLRAKGQSFGSSVHWVLAAIITLFMPSALASFENPGFVFLFFALMMVFQLLFVKFLMPETKGVSLEELTKKLSS